jgi:hypothetical protein
MRAAAILKSAGRAADAADRRRALLLPGTELHVSRKPNLVR